MAHDALGGLRLGSETGVVAQPRIAAESVAIKALPGHVFLVERRQEPIAGVFVMRRMAGCAALGGGKVRVSAGQLTGLNDRIARFAAVTQGQHQRDDRHNQGKRAAGKHAAQAPERASRLTRWMAVRAVAIGIGTAVARAARDRRTPAFPTVGDLGRAAFAHAAATPAGVRAEFARLAPRRAAPATEFLRRPLVTADIVFKFLRIHHIAYTFTTITCQNMSPSTAAANGRCTSSQPFMVLWQA